MLSWVRLIVNWPRLYIKSASLIVGKLHFHFNMRLSITFLYLSIKNKFKPSLGLDLINSQSSYAGKHPQLLLCRVVYSNMHKELSLC